MSDEQPKPKPPSRARRNFLIVAALLGLSYGGYRIYLERKPYEWSGTVEARTISAGSRVGGRVKDVLVREGQRVKAGQALLRLEAGDYPAQLVQAQALLVQWQANQEKLQRGARPEEVAQARARALTAKAAFEQAVAGARPEEVAAVQMLFLPSIFLSGYLFPLNGMPLILQVIGQLLPTTHMVAVMRGIVLRDAGPIELAPHVLALIAFSALMIWLSVRKVSKVAA